MYSSVISTFKVMKIYQMSKFIQGIFKRSGRREINYTYVSVFKKIKIRFMNSKVTSFPVRYVFKIGEKDLFFKFWFPLKKSQTKTFTTPALGFPRALVSNPITNQNSIFWRPIHISNFSPTWSLLRWVLRNIIR